MPPVGANPAWFVYLKRNKELADAISRYCEFDLSNHSCRDIEPDCKAIIGWASEIISNCKGLIDAERVSADLQKYVR